VGAGAGSAAATTLANEESRVLLAAGEWQIVSRVSSTPTAPTGASIDQPEAAVAATAGELASGLSSTCRRNGVVATRIACAGADWRARRIKMATTNLKF
jgi:hypothetical protein